MFKKVFSAIVLIVSVSTSASVFAEVVINGTRIVFNAKDKESVVQLKNNGKNPFLLQLWIDDGNPKARPGEVKVPFVINPPVIRIDSNKGQAVRIMSTATGLPKDRESIFWFNMLEVPPKPTTQLNNGNNLLQLAFRTRVKLFYRPDNLQPTPLQAYKDLNISLQGNSLKVKNTSPYYITFSKLEVRESKGAPLLASVEKFGQRMVEPKGEITYPLAVKKTGLNGATLFYSVINDYGGETTNEQVLQNKP
ncbi:molecular chaperone [Enterobacteriaceae bacterium 89]|nr:molecular chaperone [Enterobacteriaceae bacterium 89]